MKQKKKTKEEIISGFEDRFDKEVLRLAKELYPNDRDDWSNRHRCLALCGKLFIWVRKEFIKQLTK